MISSADNQKRRQKREGGWGKCVKKDTELHVGRSVGGGRNTNYTRKRK